jgi:hypothetical protein
LQVDFPVSPVEKNCKPGDFMINFMNNGVAYTRVILNIRSSHHEQGPGREEERQKGTNQIHQREKGREKNQEG